VKGRAFIMATAAADTADKDVVDTTTTTTTTTEPESAPESSHKKSKKHSKKSEEKKREKKSSEEKKSESKTSEASDAPDESKMITLKGLTDITFKMYADSVTSSAVSLLFGAEITKLTANGSVTKAMKDGRFTGLVPGSIYHVVMKPPTSHQKKKHPNTPDDARLLFRQFDADGNGTIDKNEWRLLARCVGMNMKDEDLDRVFMVVDTDANGTIEYDEFERWFCGDLDDGDSKLKRLITGLGETLRVLPASNLDEVLAIFNDFDADKSGTIDLDEFRELTCALGFRRSPEKTEELFKAIDIDGNGTLDFQEFLAWYTASTQEASGGKTDQFLHTTKDKLRKFKPSHDEKQGEAKKEEDKKEEDGKGEKKEEGKKDEKKKEDKKEKEIPSGWHAIDGFEEGWEAVAEEPAELCVKDKFVRMRGCVSGKKAGKVFQLPAGCAPGAVERFPCTRKNGEEIKVVPVTIDKEGNVFAATTEGVLCLSSIAFFMK